MYVRGKILFRFFPEKSYKDNLFSLFLKVYHEAAGKESVFSVFGVFKKGLETIEIASAEAWEEWDTIYRGYSQEIARIFGASESS